MEYPRDNGSFIVVNCRKHLHSVASCRRVRRVLPLALGAHERAGSIAGGGLALGMTRRKLRIALITAGLYALLTAVASAELHRVEVTLVTGQLMTVTVDVPPGTPVSQIQIPGLPAPVQSITDLGPVETPTPTPTSAPTPTRT